MVAEPLRSGLQMSKIKWRIYYGDGTTFDENQGTPEQAPPLNVQVIVVDDADVGRQLLHLWDWFYWDGEQWCGADIHGLLDQILHNQVTAVKQGRTLPQREFDDIKNRAIADTDFLPKSTSRNLERKTGQVWGDGKSS